MNEAKRYYELTESQITEDAKRMAMWGAAQWQRLMTGMPTPPKGFFYEPTVDTNSPAKGQGIRYTMRASLRAILVEKKKEKRKILVPPGESAHQEAIEKAVRKVAQDRKKEKKK